MTVSIMDKGPGPGEAAVAAKRRTQWMIIGSLFATGFLVGLFAAVYENETDGGWMTGTLPPWFALLGAAVTLIAMVGGSIAFFRRIDEMERLDNYFASAIAANAMLIGYPVWFILWKGGWVSEPQHQWLFGTVFVTALAAYAYRKFR